MRRLIAGGAFPPLALGLIGLSWVTLLAWDASPYGRYLNHGDWTTLGLLSAACAALPAGGVLVPALLYAGGWTLMSAAMMLPTALPLIRLFDRMVRAHPRRGILHALLVTGYLLAWAGFGLAAHVLDLGLHELLIRSSWLAAHAWIPGAAVLAIAGAFQFSKLKYHCLDTCRSPLAFISSHWHGPRPRAEAFRLGIAHGVYCVGCCWALMMLMFVVGTGSIAWMLLLGFVMAVEKNHAWGRHIAKPLGFVLLAAAGVVVAMQV